MWVEFVVGSLLALRGFISEYSAFPLSSKTNISKFQFDPEFEGHRFVSRETVKSATLIKQSRFILFIFILLLLLSIVERQMGTKG